MGETKLEGRGTQNSLLMFKTFIHSCSGTPPNVPPLLSLECAKEFLACAIAHSNPGRFIDAVYFLPLELSCMLIMSIP